MDIENLPNVRASVRIMMLSPANFRVLILVFIALVVLINFSMSNTVVIILSVLAFVGTYIGLYRRERRQSNPSNNLPHKIRI